MNAENPRNVSTDGSHQAPVRIVSPNPRLVIWTRFAAIRIDYVIINHSPLRVGLLPDVPRQNHDVKSRATARRPHQKERPLRVGLPPDAARQLILRPVRLPVDLDRNIVSFMWQICAVTGPFPFGRMVDKSGPHWIHMNIPRLLENELLTFQVHN